MKAIEEFTDYEELKDYMRRVKLASMERITEVSKTYDSLRYYREWNKIRLLRPADIEVLEDYEEKERHATAYGEESPEEPVLFPPEKETLDEIRKFLDDYKTKGTVLVYELWTEGGAINIEYIVSADRKELGYFSAGRENDRIGKDLQILTDRLGWTFYFDEWVSGEINDTSDDQHLFWELIRKEGLSRKVMDADDPFKAWDDSVKYILEKYTASFDG